MGTAGSLQLAVARDDSKKRSHSIDSRLAADARRLSKTIKVLLIGASGSGKSTLTKQIRLIHSKGYSAEDKAAYRPIIMQNVAHCVSMVIKTMETLDLEPLDYETEEDFKLVYHALQAQEIGDVITEVREPLLMVGRHAQFRQCLARATQCRLPESTAYFCESLERILRPDYLPTEQDILRARHHTVGVEETAFKFKGFEFRVLDVGGQKTDVRKWIHCFDDVSSVLFTVDMGAFDSWHDNGKEERENCLQQSLGDFSKVCNHASLRDVPTVLLLNKKDVFERKLEATPISTCFPDYKGQNSYSEVSHFIKWKFENALQHGRTLDAHFTTAIETGTVRHVFQSTIGVILKQVLEDSRP